MKYCTKCGASLKEGVKFCTSCGVLVKAIEKEVSISSVTIEKKKPNSSLKKTMLIGALIAIVAVFLIGLNFISNSKVSDPLFDIDEEVEKIEGEWHDPAGDILIDKTAIIKFKGAGSLTHGKDENNTIEISMIPVDKNRYYATAILNGVEEEFDATYYKEEKKLVFFSTLTKTSWNIKKIKE